jgi:hypothetical protein
LVFSGPTSCTPTTTPTKTTPPSGPPNTIPPHHRTPEPMCYNNYGSDIALGATIVQTN